ncbi:MAG: 50S ribosomal protein L10 [Candidatus Pacearchaeota archaeon]|jgi:large subunit ribosomal protein L10
MKIKNKKTVKKIPEKKVKVIKDLKGLLENKKTILLASIKGIPASQFQEISKKLRGKALIRVPKKSLVFRAIEESKKEKLQELKTKIESDFAILFSDLDSFDLALELIKNKTPSKAKAGQIAPFDIEIPAGPTDLVPGPAISELGALGIKIQIQGGKIEIKEPKIIAKQGDKISQGAADMMSKLDIKPFSICFIPIAALDTKDNMIYLEIKIDREETLNELKKAFSKALAFSVEIGYANSENIKFLIGKAGMHEKALMKLTNTPKENSEGEEK